MDIKLICVLICIICISDVLLTVKMWHFYTNVYVELLFNKTVLKEEFTQSLSTHPHSDGKSGVVLQSNPSLQKHRELKLI